MKKLILLSLAFSIILCSCGQSETAEQITETATTTESTTETLQTTSYHLLLGAPTPEEFASYDDLMLNYKKNKSSNYEFPLPDIVDTWEFKKATLSQSNYTLSYFDRKNNVQITLEIGYNQSYNTISEYFDSISYSVGASVTELYDRYAVRCYSETGGYSIIGITGEDNIRYTLLASDMGDNSDPVATLKEYREILGL